MKPKHYLIGGWLVLLAVAFAPTFTNNPPNYNKHTQTLTFEEVSPSTSSSLPLPLDSWSGFWLPLDSDFSSITSTTVETPMDTPTTSTPSTTTTLIPETTTTTALMVTENTTPTQETLSVIQIAQMSLGKSKTELGFSNFWCAEYVEWIFEQTGDTQWITNMSSPGQMKSLMPSTDSPQSGDVLFVSFFKNGQTDHVAIVESVNSDGSYNTIEGNGPDREFIARGLRFPEELTGFGNTHG